MRLAQCRGVILGGQCRQWSGVSGDLRYQSAMADIFSLSQKCALAKKLRFITCQEQVEEEGGDDAIACSPAARKAKREGEADAPSGKKGESWFDRDVQVGLALRAHQSYIRTTKKDLYGALELCKEALGKVTAVTAGEVKHEVKLCKNRTYAVKLVLGLQMTPGPALEEGGGVTSVGGQEVGQEPTSGEAKPASDAEPTPPAAMQPAAPQAGPPAGEGHDAKASNAAVQGDAEGKARAMDCVWSPGTPLQAIS